MSNLKMTDMFASSNKFIATLTYFSNNKQNQGIPAGWTDLVEIMPVVHNPRKNREVATLFFEIISCDSTDKNKHKKIENLDTFLSMLSKDNKAQILENLQKEPFEQLTRENKNVLCCLLDKSGQVSKQTLTTAKDILNALNVLEEQIFTSTFIKKAEKVAVPKENKRATERQVHKYFLQHTVR